MKEAKQYAVLLLLPLLLCGMGPVVRSALGPSWQTGFDPDYTYLFNGALLAHGDKAYYSDHPGTTLHFFNAAAIATIHLCTGSDGLAEDVVRTPEHYIWCVNLAILAATASAIFAAAILVVRRTGVLTYGLLLQIGVLLSMAAVRASPRVSPEPALIGLALLTAAIVFYADPEAPQRERLVTALLVGLLGGLGIGTKLTFGPILLIPLVALPGWRARTVFAGTTVAVFCALVFCPLVNRTGWYLISFVGDIIQHTGQYGSGERGVLTLTTLMTNIRNWATLILFQEWPGVLVILASAGALLHYAKTGLRQTAGTTKRPLAVLLLGVLLAQCGQLVMAIKMPNPQARYLVPMLSLLGLNIILGLELYLGAEDAGARAKMQRIALIGALLFFGAVQVPRFLLYRSRLDAIREAREADIRTVTAACGGARVIEFPGALTPENALLFGSDWSCRKLAKELTERYPNYLRFDLSNGTLRRFGWPIDPESALIDSGRLVLRGGTDARVAASPWTTPILTTKYECLYHLDPGIVAALAAARPASTETTTP